ncbi:unnamed protein product [marine sediment metagenome]|uniref:Uncharacterized protein n=1 Tax=marine sediment metagenome TaxID=412755 RepID=X1TBW9_9ZZZZ
MSIKTIMGVVIEADTLDGLNAELAANQIPVLDGSAQIALANLVAAVCSETELAAALPKVKLETRDMTAASGDVSYTGYGGQPTGLIILARVGTPFSIGSSEPALAEHCFALMAKPAITPSSQVSIIYLYTVDIKHQAAIVKTYDVDGFTLTWTKTSDPTGTANIHVFAFK